MCSLLPYQPPPPPSPPRSPTAAPLDLCPCLHHVVLIVPPPSGSARLSPMPSHTHRCAISHHCSNHHTQTSLICRCHRQPNPLIIRAGLSPAAFTKFRPTNLQKPDFNWAHQIPGDQLESPVQQTISLYLVRPTYRARVHTRRELVGDAGVALCRRRWREDGAGRSRRGGR
jgi:hypothetical protein